MRALALIVGMTAVTGASAGEFDARLQESDAITGQFVYEMRFGATTTGAPVAQSFRLQIANEGQRLARVAPFRAEYRQDTGQFLVNGMDVERTLIARQEEGGLAAAWGGWLPLVIIIGAATLIVVDGNDQDLSAFGSGGSP